MKEINEIIKSTMQNHIKSLTSSTLFKYFPLRGFDSSFGDCTDMFSGL
jgi:hypothetical protein